MKKLRIALVTGGRHYQGVGYLREVLRAIKPDVVMEGGQTGADEIARRWARSMGLISSTFPYPEGQGLSGGPARNTVMVAFARAMFDAGHEVVVVVAPGHKGTADLRKKAEDAWLPVRLVGE